MASEKEHTQPIPSLADRITDRMTPLDDMQIDAEEETDRRIALLDGPLESSLGGAAPGVSEDQAEDDSADGARSKSLAGRIARNRLYTVNETAPDAPDTRVADEVSCYLGHTSLTLSERSFLDSRTGQSGLSERVVSSRSSRHLADPASLVDWAVGESPIRDNALHLSGTPLAHLSTDKVFHYVTSYAPTPLGEHFTPPFATRQLIPSGQQASNGSAITDSSSSSTTRGKPKWR